MTKTNWLPAGPQHYGTVINNDTSVSFCDWVWDLGHLKKTDEKCVSVARDSSRLKLLRQPWYEWKHRGPRGRYTQLLPTGWGQFDRSESRHIKLETYLLCYCGCVSNTMTAWWCCFDVVSVTTSSAAEFWPCCSFVLFKTVLWAFSFSITMFQEACVWNNWNCCDSNGL